MPNAMIWYRVATITIITIGAKESVDRMISKAISERPMAEGVAD